MGFLALFSKLNRRYIKIINHCDFSEFVAFMDEVITLDRPFRRKCYLWNILRGKTFYRDLALYIAGAAQAAMDGFTDDDQKVLDDLEILVHEVISTEKSTRAIKGFVWNLTKKIPLLTTDTIQYMSPDRVRNILASDKFILNDAALDPFIDTITQLRAQLSESTKLADSLADMIGDD